MGRDAQRSITRSCESLSVTFAVVVSIFVAVLLLLFEDNGRLQWPSRSPLNVTCTVLYRPPVMGVCARIVNSQIVLRTSWEP